MTQHEAVEHMMGLFPGQSVSVGVTEWWQVYEDGDSRARFSWTAYVALPVNELFTGETLAKVMEQAETFAVEREADRLAAESDAALAAWESEVGA